MADINLVLAELGFGKPRSVVGLTSIRHLWSTRTGGLYVLHFGDGTYYAGRSIRVVRRFAEHNRDKQDITRISFQLTARAKQSKLENDIIKQLRAEGFVLRNISGNPDVRVPGPTAFDKIMSPWQQSIWLADVRTNDTAGDRFEDLKLRAKYHEQSQQFLSIPRIDEVVKVARRYVQNCLPVFVRSEKHFWEVSIFPPDHDVIMRINVGKQEAFVAASNGHGSFHYHWFLPCDLFEMVVGSSASDLQRNAHEPYWLELDNQQGVEFDWIPSNHDTTGPKQVEFVALSTEEALRLLNDELMLVAAREFALDLMRLSRTPYGRSHRLDVADLLVAS
jgi:hypothetical protein